MSIEVAVICDACGRLAYANRTGALARAELRRDVGGRPALPGGLDICGPCVVEGLPLDSAFASGRRAHLKSTQKG